MAGGNFGGGPTICVQTMEGSLVFIDGDHIAFERFLPGFALPGPMAVLPGSSSVLVLATATGCLEAYRFQGLAAAAENTSTETAEPVVDQDTDEAPGEGGKRIVASWTLDLGEQALR
jgi:Bardet-Biedl syndrome 9 protein